MLLTLIYLFTAIGFVICYWQCKERKNQKPKICYAMDHYHTTTDIDYSLPKAEDGPLTEKEESVYKILQGLNDDNPVHDGIQATLKKNSPAAFRRIIAELLWQEKYHGGLNKLLRSDEAYNAIMSLQTL